MNDHEKIREEKYDFTRYGINHGIGKTQVLDISELDARCIDHTIDRETNRDLLIWFLLSLSVIVGGFLVVSAAL